MNYAEALEEIEEAFERLEELEDSHPEAYERGYEFLDDVKDSLEGVRETIERHHKVTGRQEDAILSWKNSIEKWFPDH